MNLIRIPKFYFVILFLTLLSKPTLGQQFFRMKADFSIKEKLQDGSSVLTMGTVYFDKNSKRVVYEIKFPEKEELLITDSFLYKIKDGKILESTKAYNFLEFSIFNLALSSDLANYGLSKNQVYKLVDMVKEDSLIISTWRASVPKLAELTGDVLISQKKKQLFGLVFMDKEGKIASKQFFNNFGNYSGLQFPGEIVQINYKDGKEFYKVTTFKNVLVNDLNENNIYNYVLPVK